MILRTRILRVFLVVQCLVSVSVVTGEIRRALVIGVSDYPKYHDSPVRFAHIDALTFSEFLKSDGAERVEVTTLTNGDATREAIWDAVDGLRTEKPTPDTLFVFFSGHAELDPETEQLYLMPTDGDRARLSATGILASQLITDLRAVGPAHLLIFLDACHTGAAILGKGSKGESVPGSLDGLIEKLNKGSEGGTMAFASATKDELSWEDDESGQGIFTRLLIRGLEGEADGIEGQKDGKITAGELQAYLVREVPNRARALGKPAQHPVVSPDYQTGYVLAVTPKSLAGAPGQKPIVKADVARLQAADPELALMVQAGSLQASPSTLWSSESAAIISGFESARAIKSGAIPASVAPDSLISPVISSDGSMLVACFEPSALIVVPLNSHSQTRKLPFQSAVSTDSRSAILDSCDISISHDGSYALVHLRTVDGKSRLALAALGQAVAPPCVADYDSGAFMRSGMVLSQGHTVTIVAPDTCEKGPKTELGNPALALVADPDSDGFAALTDVSTDFYKFDSHAGSLRMVGGSPWRSDACYPAGDAVYCVLGNGFIVHDFAEQRTGNEGGTFCGPGGVRGFPSDSQGTQGWKFTYECAARPDTLLFGSGPGLVAVRVPEPILTARLMSDGSAVVVGERGGIYTFDSIKYGDYCTLQRTRAGAATRIAAGTGSMTAVFERYSGAGTLAVYRGLSLVNRFEVGDSGWVEHVTWSPSNGAIALAGKERVRLISFGDSFRGTRQVDSDCGMPTAFGESGSVIACVVPGPETIQVRDVASGKLRREFGGHSGPVQEVYLRDGMLSAAGTFKGRSQTLVTLWKLSDGKIVSQRRCPVGGAQAEKPFSFLRYGAYFAQLDTPSQLLARQSLTCEPVGPVLLNAPSTQLWGASAADSVVTLQPDRNGLMLVDPFEDRLPLFWSWGLPIQDVAITPEGDDILVVVGGRILRIPVDRSGFMALVKKRIPREFTAKECDEFFVQGACPQLKR
jgi:hypothetical protein